MFRSSRWMVAAVVLLSASVSYAQRPGGGRPGGFGGGFGGTTGGMNSPFVLAANEAVQKELNLSDEQTGDIKTLNEQIREEMRSSGGGFQDFQGLRDLPEEERNKKLAEFREKIAAVAKKVNDKFQPKLDEILKSDQRDRLKQIQIQAARSGAYQMAEVVSALKLTKEQQDKIASITKEFEDKQREAAPRFGQGGGERPNFDELRKKAEELNAAREKALAEVITADQKTQLEKLKGKPFDLAQLRPNFGGGQGGGRTQRRPSGDKKSDN